MSLARLQRQPIKSFCRSHRHSPGVDVRASRAACPYYTLSCTLSLTLPTLSCLLSANIKFLGAFRSDRVAPAAACMTQRRAGCVAAAAASTYDRQPVSHHRRCRSTALGRRIFTRWHRSGDVKRVRFLCPPRAVFYG